MSYDRVIQVCTMLTNGICNRFHAEQLVCPPTLRTGLFSVGMLDNVDYNPSSTTAKGSFHGMSISMAQFGSKINPGKDRGIMVLPERSGDKCSLFLCQEKLQ